MELREFRAIQLARLRKVKRLLLEKYPDRKEEILKIYRSLIGKLDNLRTYTLYDYIRTLITYSQEFPEIEDIVPDEEEVRALIEASKGKTAKEQAV